MSMNSRYKCIWKTKRKTTLAFKRAVDFFVKKFVSSKQEVFTSSPMLNFWTNFLKSFIYATFRSFQFERNDFFQAEKV